MTISNLERIGDGVSGSWFISTLDGVMVAELFNYNNVRKFNPDKCIIETAHQYLSRMNGINNPKPNQPMDTRV
jgi:hypothetical protein